MLSRPYRDIQKAQSCSAPQLCRPRHQLAPPIVCAPTSPGPRCQAGIKGPVRRPLSSITLDRFSPLDAHQPTMKPLRRRRRPRRAQPSLLADKLLNPSRRSTSSLKLKPIPHPAVALCHKSRLKVCIRLSLPDPALYSRGVISSHTRRSSSNSYGALSNGQGHPPAPLPHPQRTDHGRCTARADAFCSPYPPEGKC